MSHLLQNLLHILDFIDTPVGLIVFFVVACLGAFCWLLWRTAKNVGDAHRKWDEMTKTEKFRTASLGSAAPSVPNLNPGDPSTTRS